MGESVKLSNGNYIDTEGIWDNTQGKLQSEINNGGEIHTVDLASIYPDYFTSGTWKWIQLGRVVHLTVEGLIFKATATQITIQTSALGMPKASMGCYQPVALGATFAGGLFFKDDGRIQIMRANTSASFFVKLNYIV